MTEVTTTPTETPPKTDPPTDPPTDSPEHSCPHCDEIKDIRSRLDKIPQMVDDGLESIADALGITED